MLRITLVLLLALSASTIRANEPPPVPEGGITFYYQSVCKDVKTDEDGMCYVGRDKAGATYVTFFQEGRVMKITKVVDDVATVIWTDDHFASY